MRCPLEALRRMGHAVPAELERYAAGLPYAEPVLSGSLSHSARVPEDSHDHP